MPHLSFLLYLPCSQATDMWLKQEMTVLNSKKAGNKLYRYDENIVRICQRGKEKMWTILPKQEKKQEETEW